MKDNKSYNDFFGGIKPMGDHSSSKMTIIMGTPGVGKTTLAATASQLGLTILVNFENRISHIQENETLRIVPRSKGETRHDQRCNYDGIIGLVSHLKKDNMGVKYVIIDTLDEMFLTIRDGMLLSGEITDKFYGAASVYAKICNIFKELKDTGISIICTSHVRSDSKTNKLSISLTDKLRNGINSQCDNIFYLIASENDNRILQLKPDDNTETKLSVSGVDKYKQTPKGLLNK